MKNPQKIVRGVNSFHNLADLIRKAGYRSIFLITGKHFSDSNELTILKGFDNYHYIKQGSNVTLDELSRVTHEFEKNEKKVLVAIGGGSVLDTAKALLFELNRFSKPLPYFIAVPTTAGSGSEATHFAVLYDNNKKSSLVHPELLAKMVILDPSLTKSLPPLQTAISGMDAFSQAIESYWNRNSTSQSLEHASKAILLCNTHLKNAVKNPDMISREGMLEASFEAGRAINITRTTGPHALSYYLTAFYNIPHGQAVSLFLPLFFIYNEVPQSLYSLLDVNSAVEAMNKVKNLMNELGLATTLQELSIKKNEIMEPLLDAVNSERFENNPVSFDRQRLSQLISIYL